MSKYKAIISIDFDDEDLEEYAQSVGADVERIKESVSEVVDGCLDSIELGSAWVEQLFINEDPVILRLSGGMSVEVNSFD